jgi:methionine sulfoxide reductase heme-binding subunit
MSGRLKRVSKPDLRVAHEALSLATLGALLVHGLTLLGDGYLHPSLADISLPFAGSYMTFWSSAGIIAFWLLAILGLSYYARGLIGVQRWRRLHRFAALAWALGIVHSLGEGTDAGQAWFLAMTAIVVLPALGLLAFRWLGTLGAGVGPRLLPALPRLPPRPAVKTPPNMPTPARTERT